MKVDQTFIDFALARYKSDPIYTQAIQAVRPLRRLRVAADIES